MKNLVPIALVSMLLGGAQMATAQPAPTAPPGRDDAQLLAKGWTAVAGGKAAEGERIADLVLKASPRHRDGVALKISSRLLAGSASGAASALDAYEQWLAQVRQREDVFLLERVATGLLEVLANSSDASVSARALGLLAAAGDQRAVTRLQAAPPPEAGAMQSDVELAHLGDARAVQRLAGRIKNGGTRDVSDAIDALVEARAKDTGAIIVAALDPGRPLPTRMSAARALGALGDDSAVPRLREALKDPEPPVRVMAAGALARLGDNSGADLLRSLENSPVGDLRLLAVEAGSMGSPDGPWVAVATSVLKDPDPIVRLRAAELLLQHATDPGEAREIFAAALGDANPAMREAAAQRLRYLPAPALDRDIPMLRKLLRSQSPNAQIEAAGSLLRIAGAISER